MAVLDVFCPRIKTTGHLAQSEADNPSSMSALYWMALGTFAIGTEGFMIAPLLPNLAQDLSVGLVAAGQLVTVFTLSYAFSSPILTALTGYIDRRRLLIASMLLSTSCSTRKAVFFKLIVPRVIREMSSRSSTSRFK